MVLRRVAEQATNYRDAAQQWRSTLGIALVVGNQSTQNDGRAVRGRDSRLDVTRRDIGNQISVDVGRIRNAVELLKNIEGDFFFRVDQRHDLKLKRDLLVLDARLGPKIIDRRLARDRSRIRDRRKRT